MSVTVMVALICFSTDGLPVDMDILAQIESNHNPRAVSKAGARGLYQIMPRTWRRFAQPGQRWDDPSDNKAVAVRYLRWIRETLRSWGDPGWNSASHILAAYNGGPSRFRRRGFSVQRMPQETRGMVSKYLKAVRAKQNARSESRASSNVLLHEASGFELLQQ